MRKHISIFTFLLGAFAAVGPFAVFSASAEVTRIGVTPIGIYSPGSASLDTTKVDEYFNPSITTHVYSYAPSAPTFTVKNDTPGWGVEYWVSVMLVQGNYIDTKIDGTDGKAAYALTTDDFKKATIAKLDLAVKFKYMPLTIAFNGGAGVSGSVDPMTGLNIDSEFTLSANKFTKTGYHFAGWKTNETEGVIFADKDTLTGRAFWNGKAFDSTLYAQWAANTYAASSAGSNCTVTVDESGAFDENLLISWTPDGAWKKPTVTVYAGTDDKGTAIKTYSNLSAGTTSVSFNMSDLKAYYKEIFIKVSYDVRTLIFDPNEGKCDESSRRCEFQGPIGDLPEATRESHLFAGWWTEKAGGVQIMSRTDKGDQTYVWDDGAKLYAHWTLKNLFAIDVVSSPDGGGTVTATGEMAEGKFVENSTVTLTAVPATGYSFWHWMKGETEVSTNPQYQFTATAPATFIGVFTGNVYQVTFYALDGEPEEQVRAYTFGQPLGDLPMATKSGDFALEGWYTKFKGKGTKYDSSSIMDHTDGDDSLDLYANWKDVPVYHIAYNGNGSTSDPMPNQKMYCGVAGNLTSNTYERIGYHFRGWATNTADAAALKIAYADGERVTDIASTNETVTLYAAWDAITLSEAMHCNDTNLVWGLNKGASGGATNVWISFFGDGVGDGTDSCVRQTGGDYQMQMWLVAHVVTNGSLSFRWKPTGCDGPLNFWIGPENQYSSERISLSGTDGGWSTFSTNGIPADSWIHLYFRSKEGTCSIDQMTWTPYGPEPVDGKDNVTISSAAVSDGKFILSFKSDEKFDYNLLTNANLLINEGWGVMGEKKIGNGNILTFKPEIIEGQPQMFYRVDTIQRK